MHWLAAMQQRRPWSFKILGYTVSENFWPAILFPAIAFGVIGLWPWIQRRLSGDLAAHHLLDRPRDAPAHTATGLAGHPTAGERLRRTRSGGMRPSPWALGTAAAGGDQVPYPGSGGSRVRAWLQRAGG